MEAEDLGAVVAHHEALHFLLVHGEVAGLDVEVAVAREAQHVLALGVPGYAVGIGLLQGGKERTQVKKRKEINSGGVRPSRVRRWLQNTETSMRESPDECNSTYRYVALLF